MTELKINLAGREIGIKPTFRAACNIERDTGKGIYELASNLYKLNIEHIAVIIHETAKANDSSFPLSKNDVGELIIQDGLDVSLKNVISILSTYLPSSKREETPVGKQEI